MKGAGDFAHPSWTTPIGPHSAGRRQPTPTPLLGCTKPFASLSQDQQLFSVVVWLSLKPRHPLSLMWCVVQTLRSHLGSQQQPEILNVSDGVGLSCTHSFQTGRGCRLQSRSLRRGLEQEAALIRIFLQTLMSVPCSHLPC